MEHVKNYLLSGSSFDSGRWDHWLFILCFLVVAVWGSWLSWRWCYAPKKKRGQKRSKSYGKYRP